MEKAHYHSTKALQCETLKDYENAISHYYQAAQHYLEAVELTSDNTLQNTLRKCHFKALNDAKILQKKIVNIPLETSDSNSSQIEDLAKFSGFIGQSQSEEIGVFKFNKPSTEQNVGPAQIKIDESGIGQSEMNTYVLPSSNYQTDDQAWVQDDPFVRFWDKVENLVDYLPLNLKKSDKSKPPVPSSSKKQDNSSQLLQSYYFVPSKQDNISLKTLEEYEIENKTLKDTVEKLSIHVSSLENAAKENSLLKTSINQFREDVFKQRLQSRSPLLETESELMKLDKKILVQKVLDLEIQLHSMQKELLRHTKVNELRNSRILEPGPQSGTSNSRGYNIPSQSIYTAASSGLYHSTNLEESE